MAQVASLFSERNIVVTLTCVVVIYLILVQGAQHWQGAAQGG